MKKNYFKLLYTIEVITENSSSKKKISEICLGLYEDLGVFIDEIENLEFINSLDYIGGFIWESKANSQIIERLKLQRVCEIDGIYKDFCKKLYSVLYVKTKSFHRMDGFFKKGFKNHLGQARQSSAKTKRYLVDFEINIEEDNSIRLLNQSDYFTLGYYDSIDDAVKYLATLFKNLNELKYCGDYRWETIKPYHTEHIFNILELNNETGDYDPVIADINDKKMEERLRKISW